MTQDKDEEYYLSQLRHEIEYKIKCVTHDKNREIISVKSENRILLREIFNSHKENIEFLGDTLVDVYLVYSSNIDYLSALLSSMQNENIKIILNRTKIITKLNDLGDEFSNMEKCIDNFESSIDSIKKMSKYKVLDTIVEHQDRLIEHAF